MAILDSTLEALGLGTGVDSGNYTPDTLETRRKLALAMLQGKEPIKSSAQGLNSVAEKLIGAYRLRQVESADKAGQKEAEELLASAFGVSPQPLQRGSSVAPARQQSDIAPPAGTSMRGEMSPGTLQDGDITQSIVGAESAGNPNAKNPRSSATGRGQFIESTWLDLMGRYKPELTQGKSRAQILDLRRDPGISDEMTGIYSREIAGELQQAGIQPTSGNVYLGYFLGPNDAVKVLKADPNTPVTSLVSSRSVEANPFVKGWTAADAQTWANSKMGGGTRTAAASTPAVASDAAANPSVQKALMLMRNPRTAPIGQALLQKALTSETKDPLIIKVPAEDGSETSMVYDRATGRLKPLTSMMDQPGAMPAVEPAGARTAPSELPAPQSAPILPPAAGAPVAASGTPMLGGAELVNSNIGEIGIPGGPVTERSNVEIVPVRPASASQVASDIPPGAQPGSQWRGKVPEGFVQRQFSDGQWMVDASRRPVFELKSGADARAKADEKRGEAQVEGDNQRAGVSNIITSARGLTAQPGFDAALKMGRADARIGLPYIGEVSLGDTIADPVARSINPNSPAWAVKDDIRATQERLKAIIARPLFKGQGAVSGSEREMISKMIGNLDRSSSKADYQFKLNSVERMIDDMYAGKKLGSEAQYNARPTEKEVLATLFARSPEEIEAKVQELAGKYNVPRDDMADYVRSQYEFFASKAPKKAAQAPEQPKKQPSSVLEAMMSARGM